MEFINSFLDGFVYGSKLINNKEFGFAFGVAVFLVIMVFIVTRFFIWLHDRR